MKRLAAIALILAFAACSESGATFSRESSSNSRRECEVDALEGTAGWLGAEDFQTAASAIDQEIRVRFGEGGKEPVNVALSRGYIGTTHDARTTEFVIVVDPGLVDMKELEERLRKVVLEAHRSSPRPPPPLRVQAGCFTSEELLEAERVIHARDWHPRASSIGYGVYLDASDSSFSFSMDEDGREVAAALKKRLGRRVKFDFGGAPRRLPLIRPTHSPQPLDASLR